MIVMIGYNASSPARIANHSGGSMRPRYKTTIVVVILTMLLGTSCTGAKVTPSPVCRGPQTVPPVPTPEPTTTPIPTVVEPGLAYGVPCRPPCWRGLIPGQSTRQEVAQAIEQMRAEGWAAYIINGSSAGGGYHIFPSLFTMQGSIHVIMDGDIVKKIYGTTLFYYPIGNLVEQFGGPEGIYLVSSGTVCSSCEEWSPPDPPDAPVMSVPVHLLYPSQGLWFLALIPLDGLGCICPEMKVVSFCYYAPVSMQEALNDNYLADLCAGTLAGVTEDNLVEWHGFGGGY